MKKKIATILMFLFSCFCILTGCNLFTTNNSAGLSSIVATSGNISITREQLINAYNSSGYYYNQYYGYTMENALKKTIQDLINREYLLKYIDKESETNSSLELTKKEIYDVIIETWEYIDSSIKSVAEQVEKELGIYEENEESSSSNTSNEDYSGYKPYTTKFEKGEDGLIYKIEEEVEDFFVPTLTENTKYEYDFNRSLKGYNNDLAKLIKNRYFSALKRNEANYSQNNDTDEVIFKKQIKKIYENNLENAKLQKFQNIIKGSYGLEKQQDEETNSNRFYVNNNTLTEMLNKYTTTYNANKEIYQLAKSINSNYYFKTITNSSNREKYFYFGEGEEELLTCVHILVKFSDEQLAKIKEYEEDPYIQSDVEEIVKIAKSQQKTFTTERDFETGKDVENGLTLSVSQLFSNLTNDINNIDYGYSSEYYLQAITDVFNKYIYKYNMDKGIMNAKFDYIVGTKTSQMVDSFTEVVRKLYNNGVENTQSNYSVTAEYDENVTLKFPKGVGYAGAYSEPFLEESTNYTGYHIVLFTGKLKNIDPSILTADNLFDKLSQKTSLSYNQTLFEMLYDLASSDNYDTIQSNILKSSPAVVYNASNFSDLY